MVSAEEHNFKSCMRLPAYDPCIVGENAAAGSCPKGRKPSGCLSASKRCFSLTNAGAFLQTEDVCSAQSLLVQS